ncbi:hypothetical protein P5673_012136 [Acropora cervicornis]|uniref:Peptidase A2 domain-containing protein n=1 Tax=Acropora cervicornis TaxID=6130 RepID=A0AAD9QPB1_ACRCE|nr:hypothetical protein P5673_012136 [Acropora cervicornis]
MVDIESLHIEIQAALCALSEEKLKEVCGGLKIALPPESKGRLVFIRALNKYLETEELDCEKLTGLSASLSMQGKQNAPKEKTEPLEALEDKKTTVKTEQKPAVSISKFKRDFKISGQIGDVSQKDRLSFSSLAHQIENCLKNDYTADEIKEAVIKAINPALSLRSYLEGKVDLTLAKLRRIMRSHYQERTATELYHQLSSTVQQPKEKPQEFLIRLLDLKQKVLFASQETDSDLKYDHTLVHGMFVHSFSLGLKNENIKIEMKPYLEKKTMSDEELFEKLNVCVSNEMERSQKFGSQLTPKVNAVQEGGEKQTKKNTEVEQAHMKELRELKAEVAAVKERVRVQPQAQNPPIQQFMRQAPQCRTCQQSGNGWRCNHCFRQQAGLTKLVGQRCMVKCMIQGKEVEALWDTGSQVRVVSRKWQQTHLPLEVLRNVEELLGAGEKLNLEAMNGTNIPFDDWIEVRSKLAGDDTTADELTVPVLVGQKEQEYPIIGFNVIEEILSQHSENPQAASNIIQQSFPSVHHTQVGAVVNLIQSRSQDTGTSAVKVGKRDVMLPKGEATRVKVSKGMPMILEPNGDSELTEGLELGEELSKITPGTSSHVTILVRNNTERNILLKRRTELGQVHMSSGEDDDSVSVDLVDEIPSEVGVSESVSPDQDLPSDSVENHAATESTNGTSDEMESADEERAENDETEPSGEEDNAEQDVPTRPQRQRRPPQILTHNSLGNPQYQYVEPVRCLSVNPIQASVAAAIQPGAPLYLLVCPCCLQRLQLIYY